MDLSEEQEAEAAHLRRIAWLAGEYWDACRAARLPDSLSESLVTAWHQSVLDPDAIEAEWDVDD